MSPHKRMGKNLHCIDSANSSSTTKVALKCSDYFVLVRYLVPISTHQVENIFKLTYISIQLVRVRFWPPRLSMGCQFIYYSEALLHSVLFSKGLNEIVYCCTLQSVNLFSSWVVRNNCLGIKSFPIRKIYRYFLVSFVFSFGFWAFISLLTEVNTKGKSA